MTKTESLELIQELFTKVAFEQVKETHKNQIEDDVDTLPFVWKLLYAAHDKYLEAIAIGKSELDALCMAKSIFTYESIQA